MFKNEYQGGPYVEIFSTQGRDSSSHWKIGSAVKKVYEKEVKGYVLVLEGTPSTTKMTVPKDNKQQMALVQRYLVLQIYLSKGQDFSLELGVVDLNNSKRRLLLSTAQKETQVTPLHARIPLCIVRRAVWLNLCLDMVSLVGETWSGQTFYAIEHLTLSAHCKVRRLFTMKSQPPDTTDDDELYGCQSSTGGEVELIPKQVQLAPDITQLTQVLSMKKIRCAERPRNGKADLADMKPTSLLDLDLNSSANKGNFHIAFGSKVSVPDTSRRSSRQGSTTNRSVRSTLSRADGSYGSGSMRDLRDSQESVMTSRSGVTRDHLHGNQRAGSSKPGAASASANHLASANSFARQVSESVASEDQDSGIIINGSGQSHMVTPHPPREPSKDRVRRYHRVKTVTAPNHAHLTNGTDPANTSKDRVSSAGSITEETDSDFASKPGSGTSRGTGSGQSNGHRLDRLGGEPRQGSGDSLTRQSLGLRPAHPGMAPGSRLSGPEGNRTKDSVSDVIALLRGDDDDPPAALTRGRREAEEEEVQSSDTGTESSQPGEYEESDDEGSSDTNHKLHLFVSRPMQAPRRNVSPGTGDQEPNKRSHVKGARANVRRSTSEIVSSRGARPEDDFHSGLSSSEEDDNYHRVRSGQGSRPHSDTTATGSPKTRGGSGTSDRAGLLKVRGTNVPKTSVSPDMKRPTYNPALYTSKDDLTTPRMTPRQTPVRRSRRSLREIRPNLEDSIHVSKIHEKPYDPSKYQMADVTESFEARMLLSMKRQEEEELEDVSSHNPHFPPFNTAAKTTTSGGVGGSFTGRQPVPPPPSSSSLSLASQPLRGGGLSVRSSQHVTSESPYTTSDDDTSFSTWKAPAPNQMAHNYQEEMMKSRLSSDTLTSSNPRDWSSVFSPPIPLPADRDLQGTLEGQFEDLNELCPTDPHHAAGTSASEDEELDLMFDPNLNCYYDPRTLKYYELAT